MNEIIQFLLYPSSSGWFLVFKIIFVAFGLFFFGFTIWALINTTWSKRLVMWDLKEFFTLRAHAPMEKEKLAKVNEKWTEIKKRFEAGRGPDLKLAIIEADILVSEVLHELGYQGNTLGKKLERLTSATLPKLEEVWEAHKIRSDIIHDPTYHLSVETAERVLKIFERALTDLKVL